MYKSLTFYCLVNLFFITSCKTKKAIPIDITKEDLVFKAVINYEMKELGGDFVVIDKSKEKCNTSNDIADIEFIPNDNDIYWNKSLFNNLTYLSGDIVYHYIQNNIEEYKKLRNSRGQKGWIELSSPCFSSNNEYALIKIDFGRTMSFNNSNFYLLRKNSNGYKIIRTLKVD